MTTTFGMFPGPEIPSDAQLLRDAIRSIPDFPKPGILFRDISPLLKSPSLFQHTIDLLAAECSDQTPSKIVGLDARGFIFGAALAYKLGVGFVPVRKKGKLPSATISHSYHLEYGTAELEIHCDSIQRGEQVIVVDDLLATGGTAGATLHLLEKLGAEVLRVLVVVELESLQGRAALGTTEVRSLVRYAD
jgi:adenine phosphoribosyltransferase